MIRRILVLDPQKRFTIQQIKTHCWMQAEVRIKLPEMFVNNFNILIFQIPHAPPVEQPAPVELGSINEQILRLMQSLGIDPTRTKEVIEQESVMPM